MDAVTFLRPAKASAYLLGKGIRRTTKTLAKDRVLGTGPKFHKVGRDVAYAVPDLDEFALARISPQSYHSTTEAKADATEGKADGRRTGASSANTCSVGVRESEAT